MSLIDLFRRLVKSDFIKDANKLAIGTLIAQLIALAISPLLTRLFSPESFGVFSILLALTSVMSVIVSFRMDILIVPTQRKLAALHLFQFTLVIVALSSFVIAILFFVFKLKFLQWLSLTTQAEMALLLLPLLIVATTIHLITRAFAIREGRFALVSRGLIQRAIVQSVLWITLGLWAINAPGDLILVVGQLIGLTVFIVTIYLKLSPHTRKILFVFRWEKIKLTLKEQASLIRSLGLAQIFSSINQRLPILIIGASYGPVYAGYFALAERIVLAPSQFVSAALGDVFKQRAASYHRKGQKFDHLVRKVSLLAFCISILGFTPAWFIIPPNITLIFGQEWAPISFTVSLLILSAATSFATTTVDGTAVILGAKKYMVIWHALKLATVIYAAFAAFTGYYNYEAFIIFLVVSKFVLFTIDLIMMHIFSITRKVF